LQPSLMILLGQLMQIGLCALALLDLSAAFDTVDHSTLLDVLQKRFTVSDRALNWFSSYQSGRKQSVCIGLDQSNSTPLDCGVPQGSIVGPSEFISYTEDIEELKIHTHSLTCDLYADDTQLMSSMNSTVESQLSRTMCRQFSSGVHDGVRS